MQPNYLKKNGDLYDEEKVRIGLPAQVWAIISQATVFSHQVILAHKNEIRMISMIINFITRNIPKEVVTFYYVFKKMEGD